MRAMLSILAGFFLGFLLLGTLVEWLLDLTAGDCGVGCPGWRHVAFVAAAALSWAMIARLAYLTWQRVSPRERTPVSRSLARRFWGLGE
ncbi:MAG: hypothetical protein KJ698_02095 [Actinobacteria bacterium]|nr:hypothetical protein [Actinomycetota bacterium]